MKNKELKEIITDSLGVNDTVDEAYVAVPKVFEQYTESLSKAARIAHSELYQQRVSEFNRNSAELDAIDRTKADFNKQKYGSLKWNEINNMNSVYLHELYFANTGDMNSEILMESLSYIRLQRQFGTFDAWQYDFIACALSSIDGWAMLCYDTFLRQYYNCFINGDSNAVPVGSIPVIVIDMHEHAYTKDYLIDIRAYLYSQIKELNWSVIEERFRKTDAIAEIIK